MRKNSIKKFFAYLNAPLVRDEGAIDQEGGVSGQKDVVSYVPLRRYEVRLVEYSMALVVFPSLSITFLTSWIYPFLIGLALNLIFILLVVRNRFFSHPQAPLIAKKRFWDILLLLFLEVVDITTFFILVARGQYVHF